MNREQKRLIEDRDHVTSWHKWGPYLSERQWGTVREDYSSYGQAWEYVSHDAARSRAYRWGEDGIAGFSDSHQVLCFALGLWNGKDPILKERLFGLTGNEGHHGEDVKEAYYYLDGTPTNSYLKMLYKYPQQAFPYGQLVARNRAGKDQPEFELIDTGVFEEGRYFDVFVEYAKAAPEDILIRVTVHNRGPDAAELHLLPQLWFRNTWSWGRERDGKPSLSLAQRGHVKVSHPKLGDFHLFAEQAMDFLFCKNDTNPKRIFGMNAKGYFKDAFHEYVVNGNQQAVNPRQRGTKCAAHYRLAIPAGGSQTVRLRLSKESPADPFGDFGNRFDSRRLRDVQVRWDAARRFHFTCLHAIWPRARSPCDAPAHGRTWHWSNAADLIPAARRRA